MDDRASFVNKSDEMYLKLSPMIFFLKGWKRNRIKRKTINTELLPNQIPYVRDGKL